MPITLDKGPPPGRPHLTNHTFPDPISGLLGVSLQHLSLRGPNTTYDRELIHDTLVSLWALLLPPPFAKAYQLPCVGSGSQEPPAQHS